MMIHKVYIVLTLQYCLRELIMANINKGIITVDL
jgi:hypothetical protein